MLTTIYVLKSPICLFIVTVYLLLHSLLIKSDYKMGLNRE